MDQIDAKLIRELAADARSSLKRLAERAGLSPPSVAERLRKLEERGVIGLYTIEIDPAALGRNIEVLIRISPLPGRVADVGKLIEARPEIVECDKVTGDDCFVARAFLTSISEVEELSDHLAKFASTNTSIVKSKTVRRRLPPIMSQVR